MTHWIDITKREPTEKDIAMSNRRGIGTFLVCTREGYVGEWCCRLTPDGLDWFTTWGVPIDWPCDVKLTHWRRMPRPPGEWWGRVKWWFGKWRRR